jgi:Arc/MetJ-type ribon-helix-helix transcriptional regulator
MLIEIGPEDETLIEEKLRSGEFRSVDELIHKWLVSLADSQSRSDQPRKNFAQFLRESPLPGSGLSLEREEEYPRIVPL